jgi:hypothetical protein
MLRIHQESAEGPSPLTPQQPGTSTGASAGTDGKALQPMSALLAAGFLYFLLRGIAAIVGERDVYPCTLCSGGARWSGKMWVHANGQLEAQNGSFGDLLHPAIPDRSLEGYRTWR